MQKTVCVRCGRLGTRGFTQLSGNGDGSRDSYVCSSDRACAHRQGEPEPEGGYAVDVIGEQGHVVTWSNYWGATW
jgi:hypothetical protein